VPGKRRDNQGPLFPPPLDLFLIAGEDVRDLMVAAVEYRFGQVNRLPVTIEWLSDNGSCYVAGDTRSFARDIGLEPRARKHRPPPRRKPRRRVTENRKLPWSTPTVTEVTDLEEARLIRIQNGGEPGLDRRDIEWLARRYAAAEPDQADAWLRRRLADLVRPDYVEIEFVRVIEEIDASNRAGAR
jgi:hypothetical protein